jgi:beta-galactosidase GanA
MKRSLFFCSAMMALAALFTSSSGSVENVLVIDDFENEQSLARWSGPVSLSDANVSHGNRALRLDLSDRRERILETTDLPANWSGYDILAFSIFNPSETIQNGTIQISDSMADDEQAIWEGQSYRGRKVFMVKGWNHYEFKVQKMMVEEGDRALAIESIRKLSLDFGRAGGVLFLDNFRLVEGDEPPSSAGKTSPLDNRVVVDNRNVYPALYGPEESIEWGAEITELQEKAEAERNKLSALLKKAESAGFHVLYERIALETARLGLDVRSELIWFQNKKERRIILEYVIASCVEQSLHIEKILTESPQAPPLEKQARYVAPLPKLGELPIHDGYYRYSDGRPVMLLAMHGMRVRELLDYSAPNESNPDGRPVTPLDKHSVRDSELLDYFAPYDHVHESYTVGGGSRGDIESSPVYEAFHKHEGTHRVGWDGWCGHLIKDRWSMGGRKETVVICLESPHIREAVKEYMKIRYERWKKMPDLMYNIMAYELMYICYCDRSQQMFRDWLKAKHGSLERVNEIWGTGYDSFEELTAPATKNAAPVPDVNRAAWYDWACFNSRRFTDYLKWCKDEIRKLDPDVPLCAGGTSSMLSSANSTTGIDEEMIINEVDDVVLNESGGTNILSDLFLSLREDNSKPMVEPEMGHGNRNLLLHFIHGKSTIAKWLWREQNSLEYPMFAASSIPISWNTPLDATAEVLKLALDVRRLAPEIAEFIKPEPEIAILYSKTNIVQVPPQLHRSGGTPYLSALRNIWEGGRYLGCRIGFISEKQVLSGKLSRLKLLLVPAAKYMLPEVTEQIIKWTADGGTVLVVAESFLFDQYARQHNSLGKLGLTVRDVTLPEVLGEGEQVQNYDQSISQTIVYGEVNLVAKTVSEDIFAGRNVEFKATGLVQTVDPGRAKVLAEFSDGRPAMLLSQIGRGKAYYLVAPLERKYYHRLLAPLAEKLGLNRPVVAVDSQGKLVTGAEVRAVESENGLLVYASNLTGKSVGFEIKTARGNITSVKNLRSGEPVTAPRIILAPWQEIIWRVTTD